MVEVEIEVVIEVVAVGTMPQAGELEGVVVVVTVVDKIEAVEEVEVGTGEGIEVVVIEEVPQVSNMSLNKEELIGPLLPVVVDAAVAVVEVVMEVVAEAVEVVPGLLVAIAAAISSGRGRRSGGS
jgi:hypothetical protein